MKNLIQKIVQKPLWQNILIGIGGMFFLLIVFFLSLGWITGYGKTAKVSSVVGQSYVAAQQQLEKEGFKTIVITDGDTQGYNALKRDVIELYADVNYINKRFNTDFTLMPQSKRVFFKRFNVKDDVVKKVLSSWAKKNLDEDSIFVQEVKSILNFEEAYHE